MIAALPRPGIEKYESSTTDSYCCTEWDTATGETDTYIVYGEMPEEGDGDDDEALDAKPLPSPRMSTPNSGVGSRTVLGQYAQHITPRPRSPLISGSSGTPCVVGR